MRAKSGVADVDGSDDIAHVSRLPLPGEYRCRILPFFLRIVRQS